ncbi:MAG: invasin domain 3-containing protein [Acidobacteriota bacterium]
MIRRFGLLFLFLSLALLGCDSADNPVAPPNSVLSLTANPSLIELAGGPSTITISGFRPDGNRLNPGTQITLSTSLGVLRVAADPNASSANVVEVDDSGNAFVYLYPDGRTGVASITASLTNAGETGTAMVDVQIGRDATSQETVTIDANPTSIALGESSTVTVTARSSDNSPLAGATVLLRTSLGSLSPSGTLTTNSNGVATATLTSSQSGTATLTASVGSSEEVTTTVEIGTDRKPTLLINANPSTVDVTEFSQITITARDESGNNLGAGETILLTADLGVLRSSASTTASVIDRARTGSDGRAVAWFEAGTRAGGGNVTAILGNSDPAIVPITIRAAPASLIFVSNKNTVDNNGDTLTLIATVFDGEGDPLGGETVRFDLPSGVSGTFDPAGGTANSDNNGEARSTLTFDDDDLPAVGTSFDITATVGSIQQSVTITVE